MKICKNAECLPLNDIFIDYTFTLDGFSVYTDRDKLIYIYSKLSIPEQRILCLYAEFHNFSRIARILNCSSNAVKKYIQKTIIKIHNKLNNDCL